MKTKRTFLSILTLCIALLFTACSGKGTADTEKSQNTKTESGSKSADDSDSKLMIYISRKIRSSQIMKMYGTKHLA